MTNTKKRIIIVSSVFAIVVIAALVSLFVWKSTFDAEKSTFDAEWVIGKTQNEIEQRYGEADIYKNDYIEYWLKERIGYKANRIYFDSNDVAERVEYDYTNGDSVPNDGGEIELPTEMPKDFAIKFSSKYMAEEFYDTYTGTIQKDLVENGTATANCAPSEDTLKAIYAKVLEYQIYSIDRKMTNDVLTDKDGLQFSVSQNHTYEIKITANGNTYIIRGDDTAQGFKNTDNDAQGFVNFIGFMRSVLYETPEYKNLPDAVGGYN